MENVRIIESASSLIISNWIERQLVKAMQAEDGPVAITVPGGSTPFPIFKELVSGDLDVSRLEIWPGDDRIVAEDHPASNTGKIRPLFEPAGAKVVTLTKDAMIPHFTLAWLGMGADGHIASLFPNTDPQPDDPQPVRRLTPDPLPPEAPFDRITLTIPSLLNSDELVFTLGGSEAKKVIFEAAVRGEHDLPIARLLKAAHQPVICFV